MEPKAEPWVDTPPKRSPENVAIWHTGRGLSGVVKRWGSAPDPEVDRLTAEMFPPPTGAWKVAPGASPGTRTLFPDEPRMGRRSNSSIEHRPIETLHPSHTMARRQRAAGTPSPHFHGGTMIPKALGRELLDRQGRIGTRGDPWGLRSFRQSIAAPMPVTWRSVLGMIRRASRPRKPSEVQPVSLYPRNTAVGPTKPRARSRLRSPKGTDDRIIGHDDRGLPR